MRASPQFLPGFNHPALQFNNPTTPTVSNSISSPTFSLPQLSAPNLTNLITITLSSLEDYLLWKTQITYLLLSHQLLDLVDGTAFVPSAIVIDEYGNYVPNKIESQSIDGYLCEIKVIADSLVAIQCPVSKQDLVQYTLFGLDRDFVYDHIVTTFLHHPFFLSFDDLRPKLMLHKQRLKSSKDGSHSSSHHALVLVQSSSSVSSSSNKNNSCGRNKEKNNKNKEGNNGRNNNNRGTGGNNSSRGFGNNNNNNANRGCQNAAYGPQRFDSSFVPSSSNSVTRALAAQSVGGEANDPVWYPDPGAT
ncbi:uncharacterized protein LOC125496657 [Beta vulgaris subsp. vulgaris]|uniref:uncharacterized protein LOC125496657 n=1 Tax=Beta vulgaris subsp. vulgaris TaxID=3555 RepID=UPI0020373377|nr:uncharacterized protein LOC125496657 [Beta vulgaris subsp. vulgaris]